MLLCSWDSLWCLVCLSFSLYWWANILVLLFWCRLFPGPIPYFNSIIGEWVEAKKLIKSTFAAGEFLRCFLQLKFWGFLYIVVRSPHLVPHFLILKKPWLGFAFVRDKEDAWKEAKGRFHWSSWVCPVCRDEVLTWTHWNGRELTFTMCKNYLSSGLGWDLDNFSLKAGHLQWDGCRGFLGY